MTGVYSALSARFDKHHTDTRGGVRLTYVTGEQVITRLNEVLGPSGWSFTVKEHGRDAEADEMWALGRLEVSIEGVLTVHEQFGSDKIQRSRSSGAPLDIGFDLKSAATDALKKCATLIGVGLYLSEKEGGIPQQEEQRPAPRAAAPARPPSPTPLHDRAADAEFMCETCKHPIMAQTGEPINASQAEIIKERYGRLTCRECRKVVAA